MKLGSKESFFRPGSLKFFAFDGDLYCTLISHFAMIHRWAILFDDLPQTKWRFSIGSTISGNWFHGTYWMSNRMIQQWVSLDFQVFDGSNPSRPYCIILLVITHDILIICRYLMVNHPLVFPCVRHWRPWHFSGCLCCGALGSGCSSPPFCAIQWRGWGQTWSSFWAHHGLWTYFPGASCV